MKFALRAFAMFVVITGLMAASAPTAGTPMLASHLSVAMSGPGPLSLPTPGCGPGVPTCPQNAGQSGNLQ